MNFRIILLMIYYIAIISINISEYRYCIKITPIQSHMWRVFKQLLIWVILTYSSSLLSRDVSTIIVSFIACPVFALIGFALEYDSPYVFYINCSGSNYEDTIRLIKEYTKNNDNMILEENRSNKAFGCKIRFQNIDKIRMREEIELFVMDLHQRHIFDIKKRVVYSEIFYQFIVPTILYCFLFYKILQM